MVCQNLKKMYNSFIYTKEIDKTFPITMKYFGIIAFRSRIYHGRVYETVPVYDSVANTRLMAEIEKEKLEQKLIDDRFKMSPRERKHTRSCVEIQPVSKKYMIESLVKGPATYHMSRNRMDKRERLNREMLAFFEDFWEEN